MKKALSLLVLTLAFATLAVAQSEWVGMYTAEEDGGKNAGGTAIFISHELNVIDADDGLIATLKSNGYQTSKDIVCKAKVNGKKLELYFESYGEDNVFESYKPGDLLLTLETKVVKGKQQLLTNWGKFTPIIPEKPKSGIVFFVKSDTINTN